MNSRPSVRIAAFLFGGCKDIPISFTSKPNQNLFLNYFYPYYISFSLSNCYKTSETRKNRNPLFSNQTKQLKSQLFKSCPSGKDLK